MILGRRSIETSFFIILLMVYYFYNNISDIVFANKGGLMEKANYSAVIVIFMVSLIVIVLYYFNYRLIPLQNNYIAKINMKELSYSGINGSIMHKPKAWQLPIMAVFLYITYYFISLSTHFITIISLVIGITPMITIPIYEISISSAAILIMMKWLNKMRYDITQIFRLNRLAFELLLPIIIICLGLKLSSTLFVVIKGLLGIYPNVITTIATENAKTILPSQWIIVFISVSIVTPIMEEYAFRGILLSFFQKYMNNFKAIIFVSIIFAGIHLNWLALPSHLMFGLFTAWVVIKTGSIFSAILLHMLNNSDIYLTKYIRHPNQSPYNEVITNYSHSLISYLTGIVIGLIGIVILICGIRLINNRCKSIRRDLNERLDTRLT